GEGRIRAREPVRGLDHLLDRDQDTLCCQDGFLLDPGDTPQLHVVLVVGALGVHDGDVGVEGQNRGKFLPGEGAADRLDVRVVCDQVGTAVAAQHRKGQAGGARDVAVVHSGVAVFLTLQRVGPAVGDRVAEAVQRPDPGVAAPGKDQFACAAGTDELVVDDVGSSVRASGHAALGG